MLAPATIQALVASLADILDPETFRDLVERESMSARLEIPARKAARTIRGAIRTALARIQSQTHVGWPDERPEHVEKILQSAGIPMARWRIPIDGYRRFLQAAQYPDSYHGGLRAPRTGFYEKALEHYVSLALAEPRTDEVLIDVASHGGPFAEIVRKMFGCTCYEQDIAFLHGIHGKFIGGNAADMSVPDGFADVMTLHCSYDHFEGPADIGFARDAGRVLRPGGRVVIAPLYVSDTFGLKTDPELRGRIALDPGMQRFLISGLRVEFSRVYDPRRLRERVLGPAEEAGLSWQVVRVEGVAEAVPHGYCNFALVLRKASLA